MAVEISPVISHPLTHSLPTISYHPWLSNLEVKPDPILRKDDPWVAVGLTTLRARLFELNASASERDPKIAQATYEVADAKLRKDTWEIASNNAESHSDIWNSGAGDLSFYLEHTYQNIEDAEFVAKFVTSELRRQGRYDVLSSQQHQNKIERFLGQYNKSEQARIRGSMVQDFLVEHKVFMENMSEDAQFKRVKGLEKWRFNQKGRTYVKAYKQIQKFYESVAQFQQSLNPLHLEEIEKSDLIVGEKALLGFKRPKGLKNSAVKYSNIQHGRMFLLSVNGWKKKEAEVIANHVRDFTSAGREHAGRVPAAIIRMASRVAKNSVANVADREYFLSDMREKALHGWSTPADGGGNEPLPNQELYPTEYQKAVQVRLKYVVSCIRSGWEIPSLPDYLPPEVLSNRRILTSFVRLRQRIQAEKGIQRNRHIPMWRDPKNGVVYNTRGEKVPEPSQKENEGKVVESLSTKDEASMALRLILRFAPSIGMALLAMQKSSKL